MSGSRRRKKKRLRRFHEQCGKCVWCGCKVYLPGDQTTRRERAAELGVEVGTHGWRKRVADHLATIEHITPKSLGGTDTWKNVAVSCKRCNNERSNDMEWRPRQEVGQ